MSGLPPSLVINGQAYYRYLPLTQEIQNNVRELLGLIWTEACYDPFNSDTKKFANKLLPFIESLNIQTGDKK